MATTDNKIINGSGLSELSSQIKSYINDKTEISVGATAPTDTKIKLWVDTSATGSISANEVSFDNADTGLTATNVQSALEEINSDLVGSEQVQEMIDNNLTSYLIPTSLIAISDWVNASEKFTTPTDIFKRWRNVNNKLEFIYWDLDDVKYDDCPQSNKANIIGGLNLGIDIYNSTLSYPNLKILKGHYYKIYTSITSLSVEDMYFNIRVLTTDNVIWSYNYENETQRARIKINPGTKMLFLNTNTTVLTNASDSQAENIDNLNLASIGYIIIEDITPVVANGNEVSY